MVLVWSFQGRIQGSLAPLTWALHPTNGTCEWVRGLAAAAKENLSNFVTSPAAKATLPIHTVQVVYF